MRKSGDQEPLSAWDSDSALLLPTWMARKKSKHFAVWNGRHVGIFDSRCVRSTSAIACTDHDSGIMRNNRVKAKKCAWQGTSYRSFKTLQEAETCMLEMGATMNEYGRWIAGQSSQRRHQRALLTLTSRSEPPALPQANDPFLRRIDGPEDWDIPHVGVRSVVMYHGAG